MAVRSKHIGKKEEKVAQLKERFLESKGLILVNFQGIDVADVTDLRNRIREVGGSMEVVKNTLASRAAQSLECEEILDFFKGPTAVVSTEGDAVALTKVLAEFAKDNENLAIKAGLIEGSFCTVDDVIKISELPPREVLIAKLLGTLQAPTSGFVRVLSGVMGGLVNVLNAIKEKREKEEA